MTSGSDMVLTSVVHITAKDPHSIMSPDQLGSGGPPRPGKPPTLEDLYRPTAYDKDPITGDLTPMGKSFTWETIADANFPTKGMTTPQRQRQINKILAHQPDQAVIVSDGVNYAFRPHYHVIIPNQGVLAPTVTSDLAQRRWWYPVILGAPRAGQVETDPDPEVIKDWYAADGSLKSSAPAYAHRPIPIPHAQLLKLVDDSEALRKKLENAYNAS